MKLPGIDIIDIWTVNQGDDDRHPGSPEWFFLFETEARHIAKGRGWYGSNAPVIKRKAIKISPNHSKSKLTECYLLDSDISNKIVFGYNQNIIDEKIRQEALNKLNSEEKRVLGLS